MARKSTARRYWLFKSEPGTFAFDDLWAARGRRAGWDGVRNYQARNLLRDDVRVGDGVLFYHSSADPAGVAGIARVARAAHPDPTQFERESEHFDPKSPVSDPTWVQVEVEAVAKLPRLVTLEELKRHPKLARMLVVQRGQRLSIQPVTAAEWRVVLELGGASREDF